MTSISFDFSEVNRFAADLGRVGTRVRRNAVAAVKTSAFRGKKLWGDSARSQVGRSLRGYPASIDYDVKGIGAGNLSGEISAEIGPTVGKAQGSLAIVEETPGGVRGKPQRNRERIEKALTEDFVRGMLRAAADDGMGAR